MKLCIENFSKRRIPTQTTSSLPFRITSKNYLEDMPAAIMECGDYSEFQETLKNMRKVEDIIINTINASIPTESFHADSGRACHELQNQIQEGNAKREGMIKNCIVLSADRVKKLREQRETDLSDIQTSKNLRAEQTKLRMLQVELSVEELVRQRTAKVFNERCRRYMAL